MYDPTVGRWLEIDPIGFEAEDSNLYRYVGNSPTNATDPSGMESYATLPRPPKRLPTTPNSLPEGSEVALFLPPRPICIRVAEPPPSIIEKYPVTLAPQGLGLWRFKQIKLK